MQDCVQTDVDPIKTHGDMKNALVQAWADLEQCTRTKALAREWVAKEKTAMGKGY